MKYSILLPYYQRVEQFTRTLASFAHHYHDRRDYEIILVIDSKNDDAVLDMLPGFNDMVPLAYVQQTPPRESCHSPVLSFNQAARLAHGTYLVISNPEGFHKSNILSGLDHEFEQHHDCYVVCACESGVKCTMPDGFESFTYQHHMWYQHGVLNNRRLHFCTALPAATYHRIGGFDERFAEGIGYDDDDFRDRIEAAGVPFVLRDDLLTVHQDHSRAHQVIPKAEYRRLLEHNKRLYAANCKQRAAQHD